MVHINNKEMAVGQSISGFYIMLNRKIFHTTKGSPFLCAIGLDCSGTMELRCWQSTGNLVSEDTNGEVVYIEGEVKSFRDIRQICCDVIRPATQDDRANYNLADLIPEANRYNKDIRQDVNHYLSLIRDEDYRNLCVGVLAKYGEAFFVYPGGFSNHHAIPGGLAVHTCGVLSLVDGLAMYHRFDLNMDLLRTGCLLHDIGKIKLLRLASTGFPNGYLATEHNDTGAKMVLAIGRQLCIPENKLQAVVHLLRTHHCGKDDSMQPAIAEALVLKRLDVLDCEIDTVFSTRLSIPDGQLTGYNRQLNRVINFVS